MRELKLLIVIAAIVAYAACSGASTNTSVAVNSQAVPSNASSGSNTAAAPPLNPETASGADLYKNSCSKCHREDGTGGKITIEGKQIEPDDLTSAKMLSKPDEKLTKYINDGAPDDGMPAFKGRLKDQEIAAIIKYMRTTLNKSGSPLIPTGNN
jgi:mono/diheme cytochrome c family protein